MDYLQNYIPHYLQNNYKVLAVSFFLIFSLNYLVQRYSNTVKKTSNQIYTMPHEHIPNSELQLLSTLETIHQEKYFVFWNGNMQSTYHIITLLKKGYIVQPIYLEEYTISRLLGIDKLQELVKDYKNTGVVHDYENDNYLRYLKTLKHKQSLDITKMQKLRNMIKQQYSEFSKNLLPTHYVSSIQKDLQHTQTFSNQLQKIDNIYNIYIIHNNHIEFIEQCSRFSKYYTYHQKDKDKRNLYNIHLPLTQDSKTFSNLQKLLQLDITQYTNLCNKIHLPIIDLDKEKIKINALNENFYNILQ
jgi:hypothetical protein